MESELRDGYTMTELGALPEEWDVEKLGNICYEIYRYPTYYDIEYVDKGVIEVRGELIHSNGKLRKKRSDFRYILQDTNKKYPRTQLKNGDFVMSVRGTIGKVALVDDFFEGANITANLIRIAPNKEMVLSEYLLHFFLSDSYKSWLDLNSSMTTIKTIQSPLLKSMYLSLPPLPEQHRIATILSTLDETVEHTEALIEKYKNIKAGLMADLLTRGLDEEGRIRSENTHRFKDSAMGRVPEEWEIGGFKDMVDKSNKNGIKPGPFGSSLKKEFYVGDGYRVYGQEQVIAGTLSIGDYYVNKQKFEELKSFRIDMDDVLISLVGTTGKVLVVPSKFESGIINPRLLKITPDKRKSNSKFISYLLISGIITNQLATLSHGGTMDVLNGTTIRKLRFGIPSLKEQRRIAEILTAADQRIEKEEAYRDKLLQLKKGLMQDLLTGKVRVKDGSFQMPEQSEN